MKTEQYFITDSLLQRNLSAQTDLVLLFGATKRIKEKDHSTTFAGDMPENTYARLMMANFERLIDCTVSAARTSAETMGHFSPELAILISCVGRKLILKQHIEEEVEGIHDILGKGAIYTGFYSYGEISPFAKGDTGELLDEIMTITALGEE